VACVGVRRGSVDRYHHGGTMKSMHISTFYKGHHVADKRFEVELPEEVLACFGWQDAEVPHKVREALVMELLRLAQLSEAQAAQLLRLERWELLEVMGRYRVPAVRLSQDELKRELAQELRRGGAVCSLLIPDPLSPLPVWGGWTCYARWSKRSSSPMPGSLAILVNEMPFHRITTNCEESGSGNSPPPVRASPQRYQVFARVWLLLTLNSGWQRSHTIDRMRSTTRPRYSCLRAGWE